MIIDLHIHSTFSDGLYSVEEIFKKAAEIGIRLLSITDHDSIACQNNAKSLSEEYGIGYIYGIELGVSFTHPSFSGSKPISLDFLGYDYNPEDEYLNKKVEELRSYRKKRAEKILEKINDELSNENKKPLTNKGLDEIGISVYGAFGRPHIADYMVKKGIVKTRDEAFIKYLTKCNIEKMPLSLEEVSSLIKNAGGKLFLAHPNHPRGTSLSKLTQDIQEQHKIITQSILPFIDGIECWHSSHDRKSIEQYLEYANKMKLLVSGGSDCHQDPLLMGSVEVPDYVSLQFGR
ncbi:MAG: PHP domain-containing protein [Desulfatiglans sp.]|jgi:predicted metal-dependent phosphoesterase TrpH|nr:PHP domain-containing protein [Desulfatiglans sp.]